MSRPGRARLLRNAIAVPLLGIFIGGTAIAQAAPGKLDQRLRLRWFGPHGCSDGQPAARRIEELIAGSLDSLVADPLDVVAVVERSDKELRLRLSIADRTEIRERVLSAATCSELIEASALVVALDVGFRHRTRQWDGERRNRELGVSRDRRSRHGSGVPLAR